MPPLIDQPIARDLLEMLPAAAIKPLLASLFDEAKGIARDLDRGGAGGGGRDLDRGNAGGQARDMNRGGAKPSNAMSGVRDTGASRANLDRGQTSMQSMNRGGGGGATARPAAASRPAPAAGGGARAGGGGGRAGGGGGHGGRR